MATVKVSMRVSLVPSGWVISTVRVPVPSPFSLVAVTRPADLPPGPVTMVSLAFRPSARVVEELSVVVLPFWPVRVPVVVEAVSVLVVVV